MSEQLQELLEQFDGDQIRQLQEQAAQIQELTRHPGWEFLADYIIALTTKQQQYVLTGRCTDERDYARRTSYVKGMLDVLEAPSKLQQQVDRLRSLRPETEGVTSAA